jgi:MinD superfamily P-loop ATPase
VVGARGLSTQVDTLTLAVASGKGGTGKTLVASNLAAMAAASGVHTVLVDCDVEAPNDHLFFEEAGRSVSQVDVTAAEVDPSACTACGVCRNACAYGAARILGSSAIVFDELCHGCGLCVALCPTGAIHEVARRVGDVSIVAPDGRPSLTLVTGQLDVGQVKSVAVIREARAAASATGARFVVLDSPPGVACSAVASVRGADVLLLVTEPTPFGLHDLELSLRLGRDLGLPMAVLVNRGTAEDWDSMDRLCERFGAPILGRIPFDRRIAEEYARGALVSETIPGVSDVLDEVLAGISGIALREAAVR